MTVTSHMPLLERLRKGANCVVFLDGAAEPAADVADMLRMAADEIEALRRRNPSLATYSLTADDLAKAVQQERERCALIAESCADCDAGEIYIARKITDEIRKPLEDSGV